MQGLPTASQETCLPLSPIVQPGCAERAENPSGDEEDGTGVPACIVATPCHRSAADRPRCDPVDRRSYGGFIMNIYCLRRAPLAALLMSCSWRAAGVESATDGGLGSDDLGEVVVVANRAPEPLSKVGNSVTVLTDADIKDSQFVMVSDLLAQTPGLNVARVGVGQVTSIFIRGAESDQTAVLIDGVQINNPASPGGGYDFGNLLTGGLGRIEILRGSQSTLYGSQAMGGIISVMTAEPAAPLSGGLTVEGGSHNTGEGTVMVGGKDDRLLWQFTGSWLGTSGIPGFDQRYGGTRDCASQIGVASGRVRYDLTPDFDVDLRAYYTQARTDFDGYDTPSGNFGDDSEYTKSDQLVGYAGLTWHSADRTLSHRVAYQYTDTELRNYDPNAPEN